MATVQAGLLATRVDRVHDDGMLVNAYAGVVVLLSDAEPGAQRPDVAFGSVDHERAVIGGSFDKDLPGTQP